MLWLTNSVFLLALTIVNSAMGRTVKVHKTLLDIVLAFDQSGSVQYGDWNTMYAGMAEYVRSYFKGPRANQTRFAIIGCEKSKPLFYFNEHINDPEAVISAMKSIKVNNVSHNNFVPCAQAIVEQIFQLNKGDRLEAKNVVLYVTDCVLFNEQDSDNFMNKLHDKSDLFIFICMKTKYDYDMRIDEVRQNIKKWTKNDLRKVYNFTDCNSLKKRLDELLDELEGGTENVKVEDCQISGVTATGCRIDETNKCVNVEYPIITVYPEPPEYASPCQENKTTECPAAKCDQCSSAWKMIQCSVSCGNGTGVFETDFSKYSHCPNITTVMPCSIECYNQKFIDQASMSMIIGIVIGVLLLLMVLLILLMVMTRRRRKREFLKRRKCDHEQRNIAHSPPVVVDFTIAANSETKDLPKIANTDCEVSIMTTENKVHFEGSTKDVLNESPKTIILKEENKPLLNV